MTRLAFLQLSESAFGGILSVLLPSCSYVTYSANTQQVTLENRKGLFPKNDCLWPAYSGQHFKFGREQRFSDNFTKKNDLRLEWRFDGAPGGNSVWTCWPLSCALDHSAGQPEGREECRKICWCRAARTLAKHFDTLLPKKSDSTDARRTSQTRSPASREYRRTLVVWHSCEVWP